MLAVTLFSFEEKEVNPYISFLTRFGGSICDMIMDKKIVKWSEREN